MTGPCRLAAKAAILLVSLTAASCTIGGDFDVHQCDSDFDCDLPGALVSRCEASRCVPGCRDNGHCALVDPRFPLCSGPGSECVGLASPGGECYASTGYDEAALARRTARDLVVVGAFAPTLRSATWLSASLAVAEINAANGLPGLSGTQPVVLVLCNSAVPLDGALSHLVQSLGARALVGSLPEAPLRSAVEWPAIRGQALFLSPNGFSGSSDADAELPLWYLRGEYEASAPAYPALIQTAFEALERSGRERAALRIASLIGNGEEDGALERAVARLLSIDGLDAESLGREGRYLRIPLPADPNQVPEQLVRYAPDLVLLFAGGWSTASPYREVSSLLTAFDAVLPEPKPVYVVGPRNADDRTLRQAAVNDGSFRARAAGLTADPDVNATILDPLLERFASAYPNEETAGVGLARSTYDAVYHLAYAVAAAGWDGAVPSATSVATGLSRVTDADAPRVEVGPGPRGLELAVELLASQSPFDLHGTNGRGGLEPSQRGRAAGPSRAYCWSPEGRVADLAHYHPERGLDLVPSECGEAFLDGAQD